MVLITRYISEPIPVDRASIKAEMVEAWETLDPGIDIAAGTPADFLLDVLSQFHAEALQTFTQQLAISNRYGLEKIDRVIQRDAVQATASATLTRTDTDAKTVSAGTEFNLLGADGNPVAFALVNDAVFLAADQSEAVELIAVQGGTGGNGLSTVIGPATTLSWFNTLVITGTTSGGEDGETDEEFLDRGADTRPGRAFTIVQPDDLGRWLRNESGVDRAQVIDLYDADTSTADVGGHITAIPIDTDGAALSGGTMTTLETAAQALAVTGIEIHIIAPTDTTITVVFAGVAESGYDAADVESRAESAVLDFLDRSRWGLPGSGDVRDWLDVRTVRFQDIVTILNNVQGFNHYANVTGTATTSSGSPNLTVVTPTTGWVNGMPISGTGIPAATKILSGAGTATMVMTANATASASLVAVTGTGLSINGGIVDVAMTGPGALPAVASTASGSVVAP